MPIRTPDSVEIRNNDGFIANDNPFPTRLIDEDNNEINVQIPLPVDGDSVYAKDVDIDNSDIGTFTGDLLSLFYNYREEISDITASNPKTYTIHFKRPISSNQIGIGSLTGNFSNVKIQLKDLAGTVRTVIDDSANDTKYTSNVYAFTKNVFIEIVVEFFTSDAVKISGMYIPKSQSRSITSIDGFISPTNSTMTPILANATFTGTSIDTKDYGMVQVATYSDVASASSGLILEFSRDQTNWFWNDIYSIAAMSGKPYSVQTQARWFRVRYINGTTDQGVFHLETTLKPVYVKPSSHRVGDSIIDDDDAELVKSVITGAKPTGDFVNFQATTAGNFKMSVEEYDPTVDPIRKDLEGGGKVSVGTTAVEVTFTGETHVITISADEDNTGLLFVGESNVTNTGVNAITFLRPNDVITLDYNDVDNPLYVVSDTASQNFWKGSLL